MYNRTLGIFTHAKDAANRAAAKAYSYNDALQRRILSELAWNGELWRSSALSWAPSPGLTDGLSDEFRGWTDPAGQSGPQCLLCGDHHGPGSTALIAETRLAPAAAAAGEQLVEVDMLAFAVAGTPLVSVALTHSLGPGRPSVLDTPADSGTQRMTLGNLD
jgi:hypothetical protein